MSRIKKIYNIVLLLCLFGVPLLSHAIPVKQKKLSICGGSDSAVSVELRIYPNYYLQDNTNYVVYNSTVTNHTFAFNNIEVADHPVYIHIKFTLQNGDNWGLAHYLVQGNDSVYIIQTGGKMEFFGRSAGAFQCQYKIKKIKPTPKYLDLKNTTDLQSRLEQTRNVLDSICAQKLLVLESFKDELSIELYETLKTDIISDKLFTRYSTPEFYLGGLRLDTLKQQQIIDYYKTYLSAQDTYIPENSIALQYSRIYIDYLLKKTRMDARMRDTGLKPLYKEWGVPGITDFRMLQISYPEKIKDKLLTAFFLRLMKLDDILSLNLRNTIRQTRNKFLLAILTDVERKSKGSEAYDFILPDSNGKKVGLHDFKGKVVVVDFWYTGCPACPLLSKALHPLVEKKDSNVAFITISIDEDKNTWKKSIKSGLYTSDNEINLFTAGKGSDHPFITYYGVNAYPYVLIITPGGKISSVNPHASQAWTIATQKIEDAIILASKEN